MFLKLARAGALSLTLLAAIPMGAHAQQTAPAEAIPAAAPTDQTKHELITQLLEVMHMKKNSEAIMKSVFAQSEEYFTNVFPDMLAQDEDLTPAEHKQAVSEGKKSGLHALKRFQELYAKQVDTAKLVGEVTETVYGKYFTETELRDLIAFYQTPTGSKIVDLMPQVSAESMRMSQAKLTPAIQKIFQQIQAEETAAIKQKAATQKKKPAKH
ncbi:MAG: hypothetical protein JWQ02_1815 [Capsulimonas sp.]|jgi:hypothetical protein|nr:hypothetical protein [Capsulimonas sp.]